MFKKEAGYNTFTLSTKKWIESTNSIGIVSKSGRYGDAFAYYDIVFLFASWTSEEYESKLTNKNNVIIKQEPIRIDRLLLLCRFRIIHPAYYRNSQ